MEETSEGLALAAATREAIKGKKRALEHETEERPSKRPARPAAPCQHEVAIPPGYEVPQMNAKLHGTIDKPIWTGEMAKTYPFQLDSFQSTSVACIERNESVLVAAHTSAGKTAVAEYAIAKALKADQRVVYTSPLKALSNQKFRELTEEFGDVGLMTGDVTLNPNAACVVMTTEILRSMIYRGSELLREVAWVIFDEVHYMKDRERGVVWEEVIIFMPKNCHMVFLSATLPNSLEFAEWVAYVHGTPCHVVHTDYRPTPLVHYAFPMGGNGLHLLVDDKGNFKSANFAKVKAALAAASPPPPPPPSAGKREQGKKGKPAAQQKRVQAPPIEADLYKLVSMLKEKKLEPIIVFSFSRRECEEYARKLSGAQRKGMKKNSTSGMPGPPLDFNTPEEKQAVTEIFNSALQCLSEQDRELPFIQSFLPMLQRGIGVHHSGLLPILKELVEILFQETLIKCLFSTETFAMGLNMPAKTVVFTALRKWDGEETRFVESGEYIQMSGRAGRRGKDDRGFAIMMADDSLDEAVCRSMVKGAAAPLNSSFKLTYYTLVNLLRRIEGAGEDMEYVISRSFSQFQHDKQVPQLQRRVVELRAEAQANEAVASYAAAHAEAAVARQIIAQAALQPDRCVHFLRAGRIVRAAAKGVDYGYGVVVTVMQTEGGAVAPASVDSYIVDLLLCAELVGASGLQPRPLDDPAGKMMVVPVPMSMLKEISTLRIAIPNNLKDPAALEAVRATLQGCVAKYPGGALPELDAVEDMGIEDPAVTKAIAVERAAKAKMAELVAEDGAGLDPAQVEVELRKKAQALAEADEIEAQMKKSQLTNFQTESKARLAVLSKLGHIDDQGMVTMKGRAASEIDTADELLTSELMLNGVFGGLDEHQLAALVSCLIQVDSTNEEIKLTKTLSDTLGQLQETARHIASVSLECKLEVNEEEYVENFRPALMDAIYQWSKGASFGTICEVTDIMEGSIIRSIRRLDELMQNLERAAGVVGDEKLAKLFERSRETLRRGLPFAASLYI